MIEIKVQLCGFSYVSESTYFQLDFINQVALGNRF